MWWYWYPLQLLCKELSSEESDKCYRLEKGLSRMDSDVFGSQVCVYMHV